MRVSDLFLEKVTACPLCRSKNLVPAFQVFYWRENLLSFDDCTDCGACFANPMPSDALISDGNGALVRLYQQGSSFVHAFKEARQAYLKGKQFGSKLRKWKKKGKFLELGCYHGFFSLGVQENCDWEVSGLEISSELCGFVQEKLGLSCYLGTLENAPLPEEAFDFVLCHDLIEHINRPEVFLPKLSQVIKPQGRVQIITPNGQQDLAFFRRAHHAGITLTMLLNHILYFRTSTLRRALASVGLKIKHQYCYDVRHALKDFGVFGLGRPKPVGQGPSMLEALALPEGQTLSLWSSESLHQLRTHPKSSLAYGFYKSLMPSEWSLPLPPSLEIGHEIFALAEKI